MKTTLFFLFFNITYAIYGQDCSQDIAWTSFTEKNNTDSVDNVTLDLFECSCLPPEIFDMQQLKKLKILATQLISLSDNIGNLMNLEALTISKSKIDSIPSSIGKLKNLKYLAIAAGKLTYIPPEIGILTNLEVLYLNLNYLDHLPEEISKLTNLKELHIKLNRFSEREKSRIRTLLPNCEIKF